MRIILILLSSFLALVSPFIYAQAILKGKAKPHRTTRFVLLLITSLATASLFAQHDTVAIWLAAVSLFQSVLLFIFSIKYGMGGWGKIDILCLIVALLGIILWQTSKDPSLGLYASIAADCIGMVPALIKTYRFPKTEIWTSYAIDISAATLSLLAVKSFSLQQFSYPLYLVIINLLMVIFVIRPTSKSSSP